MWCTWFSLLFFCCSLAKIATVSGGSQWIVGQTKQDWAISVTKPCWASPSAIRWLDNQFPPRYSVGPDGCTEKDYKPLYYIIYNIVIICNQYQYQSCLRLYNTGTGSFSKFQSCVPPDFCSWRLFIYCSSSLLNCETWSEAAPEQTLNWSCRSLLQNCPVTFLWPPLNILAIFSHKLQCPIWTTKKFLIDAIVSLSSEAIGKHLWSNPKIIGSGKKWKHVSSNDNGDILCRAAQLVKLTTTCETQQQRIFKHARKWGVTDSRLLLVKHIFFFYLDIINMSYKASLFIN